MYTVGENMISVQFNRKTRQEFFTRSQSYLYGGVQSVHSNQHTQIGSNEPYTAN